MFLSLTTEPILKKTELFSVCGIGPSRSSGNFLVSTEFHCFFWCQKRAFWFWMYELSDDFYLLRLGLDMLEEFQGILRIIIKCFKWLRDYLKDRKLITEFEDGGGD